MELYIARTISIIYLLFSVAVAVFGGWLIQVSWNKDSDKEAERIIDAIGSFRYKYILLAGEIVFFNFGLIFLFGGFYLVIKNSELMWSLFL